MEWDVKVWDLPEQEREPGRILQNNINAMRHHFDYYGAAVSLFEFARNSQLSGNGDQPIMGKWRLLAARQGIVSAYNYSKGVKGLKKYLALVRSVKDRADNPQIERMQGRFNELFPDLGDLRQTVLHQTENHSNADRDNLNRNKVEYASPSMVLAANNTAILPSIHDFKYVASRSGRIVEFRMDPDHFFAFREAHFALLNALRL